MKLQNLVVIVFKIGITLGLFSPLNISVASIKKSDVSPQSLFEAELIKIVSDHHLPGATATFILPNGDIHSFATGEADRQSHRPMTTQTRMLAASTGKTFVSATALALSQKEILNLDAKISQWFDKEPWFSRLPNGTEITLRQLLNHTSGLEEHLHTEAFFNALTQKLDREFSMEELVAMILDKEPLFAPGKAYFYSDTNYILAGLIIEKASGRTFYELAQELFLTPLKLDTTEPSIYKTLSGLANGYLLPENPFYSLTQQTLSQDTLVFSPKNEWTGGGFISTSKDLAIWARALYSGTALPQPYLNELLHLGYINPEHPTEGYALGTRIAHTPYGTIYAHTGYLPGYNSFMLYWPEQKIAITFQTNSDFTQIGPQTIDIRDRLMKALLVTNGSRYPNTRTDLQKVNLK